MSTPFADPIAAGGGQLVIPQIRSPNFVTGVSGWIVRIDGSAEFNNLTIRGTFNGTDFVINSAGAFFYNGVPAAGNLLASIAPASGTDAHGNSYNQGVANYSQGADNVYISLNSGHIFMGSLDVSSAIVQAGQVEVIDSLSNTAPAAISVQAPSGVIGSTAHIDLFGESKDGVTAMPQISLVTPQSSVILQNLLMQLSTGLFAVASNPSTGLAEVWNPLSLTGGVSAGNDINGTTYTPAYKLMPDGNVALKGCVLAGAGGLAANTTWATVPAGYRPTTNIPVALITNGTHGTVVHVYIRPNGNVQFNAAVGAGVNMYIDSILQVYGT